MNKFKKFKFIFLILFLLFLLGFNYTKAADSGVISHALANENTCVFGEDFLKFKNIMDNPNSDYLTQYHLEMDLRKKLLNQLFDCFIGRTKNLKNTINDLNKNRIFDVLNKKLDDALSYYTFRKQQVNGLSLEGLKYTTKSLNEDRANNFSKTENIALDFILWLKNNELFNLAESRKNDISKAISLFKPDENEEIRKLFDESIDKFNISKQNHNLALEAIINFEHEKASNLIQNSLTGLLEVYKNFYELSKKTSLFLGGN